MEQINVKSNFFLRASRAFLNKKKPWGKMRACVQKWNIFGVETRSKNKCTSIMEQINVKSEKKNARYARLCVPKCNMFWVETCSKNKCTSITEQINVKSKKISALCAHVSKKKLGEKHAHVCPNEIFLGRN